MSPTLSGTVVLGTDVEVRCDVDAIHPPVIEVAGDGWAWLIEITSRQQADQLVAAAVRCRDALPEEKT